MKRKKIIYYIVIPLGILVAAGALYLYKEYNRKHKDTASLKPDYSLQATQLVKDFETAEKEANKKYIDKVIRVEGLVKQLEKDDKGFYSIILGDSASMSSVRCSVDSLHGKEAAFVKAGSMIGIKGICSGFNADEMLGSDVLLVRCALDQEN